MKVGVLLPAHPSDVGWCSIVRVWSEVGRQLTQMGHQVVVYYATHRPETTNLWEGMTCVPIPCRTYYVNPRIRSFEMAYRTSLLLDDTFDVFVSNCAWGDGLLFRKARSLGILTVEEIHGLIPIMLKFASMKTLRNRIGATVERFVLPRVERWNARSADVVLGVSQKTCEEIVAMYGVPDKKVRLLRNGVTILQDHGTKISSRAALGLKPDGFYPVFLGAAQERKGIRVAREAVRRAREEGVPCRLLNIGEHGKSLTSSEEEIGYGFVDEAMKATILSAGDAMILPTRYEGLSQVLSEGATMGLPILTTPGANLSNVTHGKECFIYPPDDVEGFRSGLVSLYRDPELASRMASAGRRALCGYTVEDQARDFMEIVHEAMDRRTHERHRGASNTE